MRTETAQAWKLLQRQLWGVLKASCSLLLTGTCHVINQAPEILSFYPGYSTYWACCTWHLTATCSWNDVGAEIRTQRRTGVHTFGISTKREKHGRPANCRPSTLDRPPEALTRSSVRVGAGPAVLGYFGVFQTYHRHLTPCVQNTRTCDPGLLVDGGWRVWRVPMAIRGPFFAPAPFGDTHIQASGSRNEAPLVALEGLGSPGKLQGRICPKS